MAALLIVTAAAAAAVASQLLSTLGSPDKTSASLHSGRRGAAIYMRLANALKRTIYGQL